MEILLLALIRFCHFLDFMVMMPLGPELTRSLGISDSQFNVLAAAYPLSAGIACFALAAWIDRFEKKSALLICFGNFTLATALCGFCVEGGARFSSSVWLLLFLARIYAGLFGGAISSIVYAYLSDRVAPEKRGRGMGILTGSVTIALVLGAPFGLQIASRFGTWQAPFRVLAALSAIVWIGAWLGLKRQTEAVRKSRLDSHKTGLAYLIAPYLRAWNLPRVRTALFLIVLLAFGQYSITPNLTICLKDKWQLGVNAISWVFAIGGLLSAILAPLAGKRSDKKGRLPVLRDLVILSSLSVTALALLLWVPTISQWVVGGASILFIIITTARMVPILTHMTELCPAEERGSLLLVQNTIQQVASSAATLIAGVCISANSVVDGLGYSFVFSFSVASSLFALWVLANSTPSCAAERIAS